MRTSVSDETVYVDFCNEIMNDKSGKLLKNFRRDPRYDFVVPGNRDGSEVFEHLNIIKDKFPEMLDFMSLFEKKQGVFGNPRTYEFGVGVFDVPMIIQIYYLALTNRYFGDLNGCFICEIGPGAGLQFKLMTDFYSEIKYTFVDLPAPLYINKKHVEFLGREHMVDTYLPCDEIINVDGSWDLVISDCAFNELHRDVQEIYIKKILNQSNRGRIAFYEADINAVIPNMDILEVFRKLDKPSKTIKMDMRVPTLYWDETASDIKNGSRCPICNERFRSDYCSGCILKLKLLPCYPPSSLCIERRKLKG